MSKQTNQEFARGHYVDSDGWHDWIGLMRDDVFGIEWREALTPHQKAQIDPILRATNTVNGPLAFGGPWSYIVPNDAAQKVLTILGREEDLP